MIKVIKNRIFITTHKVPSICLVCIQPLKSTRDAPEDSKTRKSKVQDFATVLYVISHLLVGFMFHALAWSTKLSWSLVDVNI